MIPEDKFENYIIQETMDIVLLGYKHIGITACTLFLFNINYILLLIIIVFYRPVLRDLARILVLINRKDERILIPPDDWQRLFSWAHRLLKQYKKHSSPEVSSLISF